MQRRTIGLVGGMSWHSTAIYYRLVNEAAQRALGGEHNARSILYTLDFDELVRAGSTGRWEIVAERVADAGRALRRAGADFLVITSNTGHIVADEVAAAVDLPILHIADVIADALEARGIRSAALMGTSYTLQARFFDARLGARGVDVHRPDEADGKLLDRIILGELTRGEVRGTSRQECVRLVDRLAGTGAEAIVLACTELPMLLGDDDHALPLFDTTRLHSEAAVRRALEP